MLAVMLKCAFSRPVLSQWVKCFRPLSTQNVAVDYGDPEMPDKLYKTIEIEMKSAEPAVMRSYRIFVETAAKELGIQVGRKWTVKPTKKRWTVMKSVFVHRKHLVQYEVRTHYQWIQLHKMTGSTADTFLEYVERMLPEGVALKVTKLSIEPLPSHITEDNIKKALSDAGMITSESTKSSNENEGSQSENGKDAAQATNSS